MAQFLPPSSRMHGVGWRPCVGTHEASNPQRGLRDERLVCRVQGLGCGLEGVGRPRIVGGGVVGYLEGLDVRVDDGAVLAAQLEDAGRQVLHLRQRVPGFQRKGFTYLIQGGS